MMSDQQTIWYECLECGWLDTGDRLVNDHAIALRCPACSSVRLFASLDQPEFDAGGSIVVRI